MWQVVKGKGERISNLKWKCKVLINLKWMKSQKHKMDCLNVYLIEWWKHFRV